MKSYKSFLNEDADINEQAELTKDKGYWSKVAKELSKQLKPYKVNLLKFKSDKYSRTVIFEFKQPKNFFTLEIEHDWNRDGSETKPVTRFRVDTSDGQGAEYIKDLGRYAIWNEHNYTAEDIITIMKEMENDKEVTWIFD